MPSIPSRSKKRVVATDVSETLISGFISRNSGLGAERSVLASKYQVLIFDHLCLDTSSIPGSRIP
jgi:hypothetical protein